jgi:glycosyltransferase involved in cell wall biosynthesis
MGTAAAERLAALEARRAAAHADGADDAGGADVSRPLRVLTLIDRPITSGGGERMASVIAERLDPARSERWLCSSRSSPAPTFEAQLRTSGVRVLTLQRTSPAALWAWAPLVRLLRDERIDVLHAHKFGSNVWGTVVGRLARVPVVVAHEHSWSYEGQPVRRFLDREIVGRGADAFVAVSREDERRMVAVEGVDPKVIRFIPNGIPEQHRRGNDVRAELGIAPDAPVIGAVGQLREEKALDVLIDAAGRLAPRVDGLTVLLPGAGPEEAALREAAAGLDGTVRFLGLRDDIPDVLAAMDVAVCCSHREGSPLSVMEYMAAGLPVVATRVGGVPDIVIDGEHGVLVAPGDAGAMAVALGELLGDPARREAMGARARERQREEFDLDVMVGRVQELYEELFERTARARREGWKRATPARV